MITIFDLRTYNEYEYDDSLGHEKALILAYRQYGRGDFNWWRPNYFNVKIDKRGRTMNIKDFATVVD